jgi:outer membrane protein assembly factor BamB
MGRRVARLAGAVGIVVAVAGCWPAPGQGPDRRGENPFETVITPASAPRMERLWTARTDTGEVLAGPPGPPVRSNAAVHVADGAALYGFDPATGTRLWRTPMRPEDSAGQAVATAPFADGNRVLLTWAGSDRVAVGGSRWVDARTGAAGADAGSVPLDAVRGTRRAGVARADDLRLSGTLTYLNVTDDAEPTAAWRGLLNVEGLGGRSVRPVTLGTRAVYVTGQFLDSIPPTGPPPQPVAVRAYPPTAPAVCGGDGGSLVIRCPTWSTDLDALPATSPVVGPGERVLYVATAAGTMYAIDAADGDVLWTAALGAAPSADPALSADTLFVPLVDGDLAAVPARGCRAATCPVGWRADVGGAARQPAVGGGVVIVGTRGGTLQLAALDASGCGAVRCAVLWRRPVGAPVSGAPAVTGGRVYASLGDGSVVAFAPRAAG